MYLPSLTGHERYVFTLGNAAGLHIAQPELTRMPTGFTHKLNLKVS
jgi:hypothetical protein